MSIKNKKIIENICFNISNIFDNNIVACGGLCDYFHLNEDIKSIKDFDFYIHFDNLCKTLNPNKELMDCIVKDTSVTILYKKLLLIKRPPFFSIDVCCFHSYIGKKKYLIDIFVLKNNIKKVLGNFKNETYYIDTNKTIQIETIHSRIYSMLTTIKYGDTMMVPMFNKTDQESWFSKKKQQFNKKLTKYKKKYPKIFDHALQNFQVSTVDKPIS